MSSIGAFYERAYEWLCGRHPNQRPWHFQWLATKELHSDMRHILVSLKGNVLDVGCGSKPYRSWFGEVRDYVGLDIAAGPEVDVVVDPAADRWPLENDRFDIVLCTQVVEHVSNVELMRELLRVTKPGGVLVASVPFIYNEHGAPHDYRRYSVHGVVELFTSLGWRIVETRKQGGIGGTIGILFLNWFDAQFNSNLVTRIVKGLILPVFLLLAFVTNLFALLWDKLDNTGAFYNNVILVATKPCASHS